MIENTCVSSRLMSASNDREHLRFFTSNDREHMFFHPIISNDRDCAGYGNDEQIDGHHQRLPRRDYTVRLSRTNAAWALLLSRRARCDEQGLDGEEAEVPPSPKGMWKPVRPHLATRVLAWIGDQTPPPVEQGPLRDEFTCLTQKCRALLQCILLYTSGKKGLVYKHPTVEKNCILLKKDLVI
jgi:hypothetical protein